MQIEADVNQLAKQERGKMTVTVKVTGTKKVLVRLWLGKAIIHLGARIAGMKFRSNHSVEIEVA